jgi:hypothetical protein
MIELGCFILAWRLGYGNGKWEMELACNIKELQNSIGTCSSTRSFYASDYSNSFHS